MRQLIDGFRSWPYRVGMCFGSALRTDIRVSIQDRSAPDRVSGHLATGILADGDIVLIPNPGGVLLKATEKSLQALVFPMEIDEHSRIDVVDVWKFSGYRLSRADYPVAATGRLAHHSTYAAQIRSVDPERLASELDNRKGDLWEALYALEAIPPGVGEIDRELLAAVDRIERAQHRPKRTDHAFDSYGEMTGGWCIFFCFCHPHDPA